MAGSGSREREIEVAERSLQSAESCLVQRNYGRAFAHYLLVLKLTPEKKEEIKDNFTLSLKEWADQLESSDRMNDLLKCYQQAYELFPECETMLNNMGAQLFRLGFVDEAACYFRNALKLDPDFLQARENLENICSHLVERWHFRMLNDHQRNSSYGYAIHKAIANGQDIVLDIGTGTGLLSMYAAEGEARQVFGCEMSKTMYEMSCDVIGANQMSDKITLIHKKSTDLTIPEDLPCRVSLVVTETFDAGLFGEQVLTTLHHAWQHLLLNDKHSKAKVIPYGATVFISAIECESIRKQNRLLYPGMRYIDLCNIEVLCKTSNSRPDPGPGAETSNHTDDSSTTGEESDMEARASHHAESREFEPYTTENLSSIRGGYKLLSEVVAIMHFNFNDPESISSYMAGIQRQLALQISANGRVDALAMWFDLHLDEEVTLSSSPQAGSCWEQAIYPVLPTHLLNRGKRENFLVRQGDCLQVNCEYRDNALTFKCEQISRLCELSPCSLPPSHSETMVFASCSSQSSGDSKAKDSPAVDKASDTPNGDSHGAGTSTDTQTSINGESISNSRSFDSLSSNGHGMYPIIQCKFPKATYINSQQSYPACPTFKPLTGRKGADMMASAATSIEPLNTAKDSRSSSKSPFPSLHELNSPTTYFLDRPELGRLNDIDFNQAFCSALQKVKTSMDSSMSGDFTLLDSTNGISILPLQALKLGAKEVCLVGQNQSNQQLLQEIAIANEISLSGLMFEGLDFEYFESNWSVLVTELVEPCGCLRQQVLEDIVLARVTCVRPEGVVIPHRAHVYGMLIESSSLHRDSAVTSDENASGFLISGFMNDFQVTTHMDIDLATLDYKKLSEPFEMLAFNFNNTSESSANIPNFLHQKQNLKIRAVETGQVTAVVYWFDMVLTEGVKVCTLNQKMHWKQAAVMQRNPITVSTGSEVAIKSVCKNSCIDVSLKLL